jgi:tetratricopeptide (TPR) repeat protein
MGHLTIAEQIIRRGRFSEALQFLERSPIATGERLATDALRAELLERTGQYSVSKALAEQLLRNPRCLPSQRCSCLMALAYHAFEHGYIDVSMNHFQKALSAAEACGDLRTVCICQLRVMNLLADRSGYLAITPILAQIRRNVTQLGDGATTAALHISIGEVEAKRGFVSNATKHVVLARNLLANTENIHWEGVAENILTAIAIMQSDHSGGIEHGKRAVQFATTSGSHSLRRAAMGNLGNLHLLTRREPFQVAPWRVSRC